jgi:hypothetical protein
MAENQFEIIKKELANNPEQGRVLALVLHELKPHQLERLQQKAAEGKMSLELEQIRKVHQFQASAADIDAFITQIKQLEFNLGKGTSFTATHHATTATGHTTIEVKKGKWCFVATAIYGDAFHPDVSFLQMVRDTYLRKNFLGRRFIATYYKVGPRLANSMLTRGVCGKFVRAALSAFCTMGRMIQRKKR